MQAVLECKSCGGQLQPADGQKVVYCAYCGSANVFTFVDRFALYNQANYLRQRNEFDRAISVYENIINEDPKDAEAYFGIALCKYGIEYVDDPGDGRKIPTCHRTRIKLFSQDDDYLKAVGMSDPDVAEVYRAEAERIDHILKGIQKLSHDKKKYDVFICYKEGDGNGNRTQTSVIAQDIYEQLENRGYRVFFARKTLAGMIGSDYEPVIFSALYSAKVMLVIGTRPEEFQGIWVKNEWIRFLERIAEGDECTLIPCYKEMSPYELPQEMVNIQSLDISKIGFMQDITDALERLIKKDTGFKIPEYTGGNADSLKKRAYLFLEQGDFNQAIQYFEKVLDIDPEDSECYWGKLLAEHNCRDDSFLKKVLTPISSDKNYLMAIRFADEEQAKKYKSYCELIDKRVEEERRRKEEQARIAAEEAEQRRMEEEKKRAEEERIAKLEAQKKKKRKKRVIKGILLTPVIIAIYILFTEPILVRAETWYTAYIKDDPASARLVMDIYECPFNYGFHPIKELNQTLRYYFWDEIFEDSCYDLDYSTFEKIMDIKKGIDYYCMGYPKVKDFYEKNSARSLNGPQACFKLKGDNNSSSEWILWVDDGEICCDYTSPSYIGDQYDRWSNNLFDTYKSDKSLVKACEKHNDIEKLYVSLSPSEDCGVLLCIDADKNVYAEPFGKEGVLYYGIKDVGKLKDIELLRMCPDESPYLYALKSNGDVVRFLLTDDKNNKDKTGVEDTEYDKSDWNNIPDTLHHPSGDIYKADSNIDK
ncbi:MAG: TIR domain-containing protein [Lachnospiraceae bacterium]|nr:TIR domain-containing protein [Lachnospiraceae bacterium]